MGVLAALAAGMLAAPARADDASLYRARRRAPGPTSSTRRRSRRGSSRFVVERRRGRFRNRPASEQRAGCGTLRRLTLGLPVFGGRGARSLAVAYRLAARARASITLLRGRRVVRRHRGATRSAGRTYRLRISPRRLRRATYHVRLTVTPPGGRPQRYTVAAKRL